MSGDWLKTMTFYIEGIFMAIIGIIGILSNIISVQVFSSKNIGMKLRFRHLLRMLAIFEAIFLITTIILFCPRTWSTIYEEFIYPMLLPHLLPIIQITLTGSVWITTAVSMDRFFTICLGYYNHSKLFTHLFYTLPIVMFSVLFNAPRFFELTTVWIPWNETIIDTTTMKEVNVSILKPIIQGSPMRQDQNYITYYIVLSNAILLTFIPMFLLLVLNGATFRTIKKGMKLHNAISVQQRQEHKAARMLISIVTAFIICHSIRFIINMYECLKFFFDLEDWPVWIQVLVLLSHLALVSNSSINIFIYARNKKFLRVLLTTLRLRPQPQTNGIGLRRLH